MMISTTQIQQLMKTYGVQGKKTVAGSQEVKKTEKKSDETVISQEAKTLQAATKALKDLPEIRQEKVGALQEALRSGSYNPTGEEIAEKILGRSLVDRLL